MEPNNRQQTGYSMLPRYQSGFLLIQSVEVVFFWDLFKYFPFVTLFDMGIVDQQFTIHKKHPVSASQIFTSAWKRFFTPLICHPIEFDANFCCILYTDTKTSEKNTMTQLSLRYFFVLAQSQHYILNFDT